MFSENICHEVRENGRERSDKGRRKERKQGGEEGERGGRGGGVREDGKELTGCEPEDWHPTFGTLQLKQIAFPLPPTLSVLSSVYRQ